MGEEQSPVSLATIAAFGVVATLAIFWLDQGWREVGNWRVVLGALLVFDISAGCIANFTPGTNRFYAARPRARHIFIAIHVHLLVVAFLLDWPMGWAATVWIYTIAASAFVNSMGHSSLQPIVGAFLTALGLIVAAALGPEPLGMMIVSQLFIMKLVYGFAVNHYR